MTIFFMFMACFEIYICKAAECYHYHSHTSKLKNLEKYLLTYYMWQTGNDDLSRNLIAQQCIVTCVSMMESTKSVQWICLIGNVIIAVSNLQVCDVYHVNVTMPSGSASLWSIDICMQTCYIYTGYPQLMVQSQH